MSWVHVLIPISNVKVSKHLNPWPVVHLQLVKLVPPSPLSLVFKIYRRMLKMTTYINNPNYICLGFFTWIFFFLLIFVRLLVCLFVCLLFFYTELIFILHILYDNGKDWKKQNVTHCIIIVNSFAWKIILNDCDALCSIAMEKKKSQYAVDRSTISNEDWYQYQIYIEMSAHIG